MKRNLMIALVVLIALLLTGCSSSNKIVVNNGDMLITVMYDQSGTVMQRSEYNRNTGITVSYLYTCDEHRSNIDVVIIDANGTIISSTQK